MIRKSMMLVLVLGLVLHFGYGGGGAEMSALTDEEMEEARVNIWNLSLTLKVDIDLESESDDLFDDEEETRLDTHLQESSTPDSKEIEHISHRWERVTPSGRIFGFDNADLTILTRELDIHKH
jgi:hypothetical protein